MSLPPHLSDDGDGGALLRVKAVPGAKRDEIVGALGDRLKVRISAPPEGGRANESICALLALTLRVRPKDVTVVQGHTAAVRTVRIAGLSAAACARLL